MKKVVVLGAGYAGLKVVHELQKRANGQVEITLVDTTTKQLHFTKLQLGPCHQARSATR